MQGGRAGRQRAGLRTLDETGSVVLGRVRATRQSVRLDAAGAGDGDAVGVGDGPAVEIPIDRITRAWVTMARHPGSSQPVEEVHIGTEEDPARDVVLPSPPPT